MKMIGLKATTELRKEMTYLPHIVEVTEKGRKSPEET